MSFLMMKNFTSRLLATLLAAMMIVVAACTSNEDEGIIPVTSTQEMIDLSSALKSDAQIVSAAASTASNGSFVIELDNGNEYTFPYEENNIYTVSSSGVWQLNASNVSGSPYYTTLRAQTATDIAPTDGSKATDPELEGKTLYWVAGKNSNGSWLWNPYYADSGIFYSNTILYLTDTPDLLYNSQTNSLILVVNGSVETYEAEVTGGGDVSVDGDTLRTLVSSEFTWSYENAVAGNYSFSVSVMNDGSYGLLSTQRDNVAATSKEPTITITDADTGDTIDPELYGFEVEESNAGGYSDPYIVITTTNTLKDACNLYVKLTYEQLADDGIANLVVTVPIVISGAPTATFSYIKSTDYYDGMDEYWSITNELYSEIYYGCTWSDNYDPEMFGITDGMADKYAMATLETPIAALELDDTYTFSLEGVNDGNAIATLTKSDNAFGIDLEKEFTEKLLDVQMDFSPEDEDKYVTMTDPVSGFKLVVNPAFFTINDGERVAMRNSGATFDWNYRDSYAFAMGTNTENPYSTAFMKLTIDGDYTDLATQLSAYISGDEYKSSISLGEASSGSTVGLDTYKASDFSFDLDVDNKGVCYVSFIGKSIMATDAKFSIIVTLPEAYTPVSGEAKNIVITVPITINGAPRLYATRTQGPTQVLLGNMVYTSYGTARETLSTSNDLMIGTIHGMTKYDSSSLSAYSDASYPTTAAPDGYDSVNDVYTKFDSDRTTAESIIEASIRGASYISSYNMTLSNETFQGMSYKDFGYADLTTPNRYWQRDNALGYGYGFDLNRLEDFIKTSDFFTGVTNSSYTTVYCTDVYTVESFHPTGFSYTMSGYIRLGLRLYYYMTAVSDRFVDNQATVADDGVLDGIYDFTAISSTVNTSQLADLVVRYEVLNAPTDGSDYPIVSIDDSNQSILNMKGCTGLTELSMAAYMTMPIDYSDTELRFYDGAATTNKGYAYKTFTLTIDDGFAGVAVHSEATATSSTGFAWSYDEALVKSYTVSDYVIDGLTEDEFARIVDATPDTVEVTAGTFEAENIEFALSTNEDGEMVSAITLSDDTLSTTQSLTVQVTYEGMADNGENVIIDYTVAISGAPSVVVGAMVAEDGDDDGMVDFTQLGDMPWIYIFGEIKSQLETGTWTNGTYEGLSSVIDDVINSLAITSGVDEDDERLIITDDNEMAIKITNDEDYSERTPISYTSVVLEDEATGFSVTYSGLSLTLFDPANTFVTLDTSVGTPSITWNFATSNVFSNGAYTGVGYSSGDLLLSADLTDDLYGKISNVTPSISFSGSDSYKGLITANLSSESGKYYIDLHFASNLAETVSDLIVYVTYEYTPNVGDSAKVIMEVPMNVQGGPRLICSTRTPTFWFDGALNGSTIGGDNTYSKIFSSNLNVTSTTNAAGETIAVDGWNTVYTRFNDVNGTATYGGTDAQSLVVTSMSDEIYYKSNSNADGYLYLEYLYGQAGLWNFNYRIDTDKLQETIDTHDYYASYPSYAEYPTTKDVSSSAAITDMKMEHASGYSVYYQFYCIGFNFAMEMIEDSARIADDVATVEEDTNETDYGVLDGIFTTSLFDSTGTTSASTVVVYEIDTTSENYSLTNYPTIETDRDGNSVINWNGYTGSQVDMIAYLAMPLTGDIYVSGSTKQLVFHNGASDDNKKYAYREFTLQVSNDFAGVVTPSYGAASSDESSERFAWDYDSATAETLSYTVKNFDILGDITDTEYDRILNGTGYATTIDVTSENFDSENISVELLDDMFANVTLSGDTLAESKTITFDLTYAGAADNGSDVVIEFTIAVDGAPAFTNVISYRLSNELVADPYTVALATIKDEFGDTSSWIGNGNVDAIATAMSISYTDEDEDEEDYTLTNVDGVLTLGYPNSSDPLTKTFTNVVLTDPYSGLTVTYSSITFEIYTAGTISVALVEGEEAEMMWMYETAASIVAGENNDAKYSSEPLAIDATEGATITAAYYDKIMDDGAEITPSVVLSGDVASSYSASDFSVSLSEADDTYYATLLIYDKMSVGGDLTVKATFANVDDEKTSVEITIPVTITGAPVFGKSTAISWSSDWTQFTGQAYKIFGSNLVDNSTSGKINATTAWKDGGYAQFGVSEENKQDSASSYYQISNDGTTTNSQIYAAVAGLYAEYTTLPASNRGYFTVANKMADPLGTNHHGVRIDLDAEVVSAALLAMSYDTTTAAYPFKQISSGTSGSAGQENFGVWISAEFDDSGDYYVMKHATGFEVQVGYHATSSSIVGIGVNNLNFNASLVENNTYFTGTDAVTIENLRVNLNDIYTIQNTTNTSITAPNNAVIKTCSILFEVTDNSGVTVNNGVLNWGDYSGDSVSMSATLQMTSTETDNVQVFSIHKYSFTVTPTVKAENVTASVAPTDSSYFVNSDVAWDYTAATGESYSLVYTASDLTSDEVSAIKSCSASISVSSTTLTADDFEVTVGDDNAVTLTVKNNLATAEEGVVVTATYAGVSDAGTAVVLNFEFDVTGAPASASIEATSISETLDPNDVIASVELADLADAITGDLNANATAIAAALSLSTEYTSGNYTLSVVDSKLMLSNATAANADVAVFTDVVLSTPSGITLTYPSITCTMMGDVLVSETTAKLTWNYAKSHNESGYSTTVQIDSNKITGSLEDGIAGWTMISLSGDDATIYPDASVELSDLTKQNDESYRVTVTINSCNMATTASNLSVAASDGGYNSFTIPVEVVGAPTVSLYVSNGTDASLIDGIAGFADYVYDYDYTTTYNDSSCVVYNLNGSPLTTRLVGTSASWSGLEAGMFGDDTTAEVSSLTSTILTPILADMTLDACDDNKIFVDEKGDFTTTSEGNTFHAEFILYTIGDAVCPAIIYNRNSPNFKYSYTTPGTTTNDNGSQVRFGDDASFAGVACGDLTFPVMTDEKSGLKFTFTYVAGALRDYNDYFGKYSDVYPGVDVDGSTSIDVATSGGNDPA